ncbi:MAG: hypothetical protein IKP32_06815 [Clostridia bacterium]|nr:hypothetical protein [Clostridia bacterium]
MYKKQMKLQKLLCILSIAASALVFLYSLGIMTDLFDMLYNMMPDHANIDNDRIGGGARIYYDMQDFNHQLLWVGIILILISCSLLLTNTHTRRKYYISNYISIGLTFAANVCAAVWGHVQIAGYKQTYLSTIDFTELERQLTRRRVGDLFTSSTFWFDIHYFVFVVPLIVSILLVLNLIWKIRLMNDERSLLEQGKAVS